MKLRPYQGIVIDKTRAAYRNRFRAPLIVLPTGGGKGAIAGYIGESVTAAGTRTAIIVHRYELMLQLSEALDKFGVAHGLISPKFIQSAHPIQVASVQTLLRRIEKGRAPAFDFLIFDEAHHCPSKSWAKIIANYPRARRLGLTATPYRLSGEGLSDYFDTLVIGPSTADLIADGYLSDYDLFMPPTPDLDLAGVRSKMGDFERGEVNRRVDKPTITGSAIDHYAKICPGVPAVAFCASIAHSEHVAAQFSAAGIRAKFIAGDMTHAARKALINALATGEIQVLTAADLISEGVDIPVITAGILLRPTQSLSLYLQQIGRALRPVYAPGMPIDTREQRLAAIAAGPKRRAVILDHVGNALRHGLPDSDREWSLEGREKRKRAAHSAPQVAIKQCPKCFLVHEPSPSCPACGYAYEIRARQPEQTDGELRKITDDEKERLRRMQRAEVAKARTRDELEAVAKARGYKANWVDHILKARGQPRRR